MSEEQAPYNLDSNNVEVIEIKTKIYYYQYLNDDKVRKFLETHVKLFHFGKDGFSCDPNTMKITQFDEKGNQIIHTLKKGDYIFIYNGKIVTYDKNQAIDLLFQYRKLASK